MVVKIRREEVSRLGGRREEMWSSSSSVVVVDCSGIHVVDGSESPGKALSKTLTRVETNVVVGSAAMI